MVRDLRRKEGCVKNRNVWIIQFIYTFKYESLFVWNPLMTKIPIHFLQSVLAFLHVISIRLPKQLKALNKEPYNHLIPTLLCTASLICLSLSCYLLICEHSEKAPCTQMAVFTASLAGCKTLTKAGVTLAQAHHCGGVCRASQCWHKACLGPQVVWLRPTLPQCTHTHTASLSLHCALSYGNVCNLWRGHLIGLVFVPKSLLVLRNRYFSVCTCVSVCTSFIWRASAFTHTHKLQRRVETYTALQWMDSLYAVSSSSLIISLLVLLILFANLHRESDKFVVW